MGHDPEGLERELRTRLDWYASHVGEEGYDAKAVEYILYLLDRIAPLEEGSVPQREDAWERFRKLKDGGEELLPLAREEEAVASGSLAPVTVDGRGRRSGNIRSFAARHKAVAAVVFVVLVLAIGGGLQAGVRRGDGFFFWLKEDETGTVMMTSPDNLDLGMGVSSGPYFEARELPAWAQEWVQMKPDLEIWENYEWECYETSEIDNLQIILSKYRNSITNKSMLLGMVFYHDKIIYDSSKYEDYNYVQSFYLGKVQTDLYSKIEDSGEICYIICFYEGNCGYFIQASEELEDMKEMTERYWMCVEKQKQ